MKRRGWPDRRGMGARSDFISEQFVPSERYKEQQRVMAETIAAASSEENVRVTKQEIPPHLIPDGNLQRCSACGYPFPADVHPSMSVAFAEHLLKAHKVGQATEG
jgi:hypothetical protein